MQLCHSDTKKIFIQTGNSFSSSTQPRGERNTLHGCMNVSRFPASKRHILSDKTDSHQRLTQFLFLDFKI